MSDRLENGTIVDGRYKVVDRLGAGGMADVYRAEDLQLGRPVALKLLYRRFAEDAEFSERFRREASSAAGLQHPNVVGVYDRGTYAQTAYIAMEYVDGRTLKQIVNREGPLEPARAVALVEQVLRAARFAHRRGVIHRDLKPHNVIVDAEDRAKVTDFGIAKAGASDMTQTGSIMGTAQYLSPEQAQGLPVSAESDLYSVGIMLYELLTGEIPFDGESAVTIALKQVSEPPISPSIMKGRPGSVPAALEQVVLKALAKAPEDRFADADAFIEALEEAMEHPDRTPAAVLVGNGASEDTDGLTVAVPTVVPVAPLPAYGPVGPPTGPLHEERRGGGRWWLALLALLVVAGIALGAVLLLGAKKVTVPSVVGADQAQAQQTLRARGLNSNAVPRQSTRAEGTVIGQDPAPGSRAEEDSTVDLTISSGPGEAIIPDLGGQRRLAARKALEDLGYEVAERREASDTITTNRVIETVPGAGSTLVRGQSVTLVLSSGAQRIAVPSVRGQTEAQARAVLEGADFVVRTREREDEDAEPGTVIEQAPTAGAAVGRGSTVTLTIAKEPATVTVPDVRGRSQQTAGNTLLDAGFNIDAETTPVDDPDQDGRVVTQSPAAGSDVERGATVTITVGAAPSDGDSGTDGGITPTETTPPETTTAPAATTTVPAG